MGNVSSNLSFIAVDSETYDFKESNQKPIPEGSALFTLNNIENYVKKYLSNPVAQKEFELDLAALKDRIQQIKTGYDQKFEKISWRTKAAYQVVDLIYNLMNRLFSFARINYRFETEQNKIDKVLLRINHLLQPPTALPPELVIDVQKEISAHLDFTSLCQFALVNRNAYQLAASSMLVYARECGFEGESPVRAKAFMKRLLMQACVMRTHLAPRATFFGIESYSLNMAEEMLHGLRSFTTEEMLDLFVVDKLYNRNSQDICPDFRKFLCYIGKDWEKILIVEDDEILANGLQALRNAIDYNEPGFVNLLLQHGIEPTDDHLTLSVHKGKGPEVVRLLLDHQACINKEKGYILKGLESPSFEIRRAIYDFDLNYCFGSHYLIERLAGYCRYEHFIDCDNADLEYILESAAEKRLSLGNVKQPLFVNLNEKEDSNSAFKPLSKNCSSLFFLLNPEMDSILNVSPREDISDAILLLIKYGFERSSALALACSLGYPQIVEKILESSEPFAVNILSTFLWWVCDGVQLTPLSDFSKNLDIVKLLLKYGASTNCSLRKNNKKTVLQLAEDNGLIEIVEVLRGHHDNKKHQKRVQMYDPDPTSHYDSKTETKEPAGT